MKTATFLPNLTPFRGVAALLTVIFHVQIMGMGGNFLIRPEDSMILHRLYLMVDFFFILSGFIMCHVYGNLFAGAVRFADFKKFTIARFARVYPLHFVMLMYTVVLFFISSKLGIPKGVVDNQNSLFSFVTNLFLLQSMNLHEWFSWVHASWSISTEWWAYMIFPFLVTPFIKMNSVSKVLMAALCVGGYLGIIYFIVPIVTVPSDIPFVAVDPADLSINVGYQYGFLRCMTGFLFGMVMYQAYTAEWGKRFLGNGYTLLLLTLGSLACMHFNLSDIYTVCFFPLILLSGAYGSTGMDKLFGTKALQKLGDWSFSIYLVHQPLFFTVMTIILYQNPAYFNQETHNSILVAWCYCFALIGLTLFFSYLTYRFIEVPARRWINPKK